MLNQVKVKKLDLLKILKGNRENHNATFLKAQEEFRKDAIAALDEALERARSGGQIKLAFQLPFPEEHTHDYDTAIEMLEMSVDEEIELTGFEFMQFVRDEWEWRQSFLRNTIPYASKSK